MGPSRLQKASPEDLGEVAALARAHRRRLARWSPRWWKPSHRADELHLAWLELLVASDAHRVRVLDVTGRVVGCAVCNPQGRQWFVDDVGLADDASWSAEGIELLAAIPERPALTCIATKDAARRASATAAGLVPAASYWVAAPTPGAVGLQAIAPGAVIPGRRATPSAGRSTRTRPARSHSPWRVA